MWKAARNDFPRSDRCNPAAAYYYTVINYCNVPFRGAEVKESSVAWDLHQYYLQRKWKVYSNNLCKRIWESLILAVEAGGGIKQQDAKIWMSRTAKPAVVPCLLLSSLFFYPGQKMDLAREREDAECQQGALQAGALLKDSWSEQPGPCSHSSIPKPLWRHCWAQHSTYYSKGLVGGLLVKWGLQCLGRTDKGLFGKSYLPPSSHQLHPRVESPFIQQLEPAPKSLDTAAEWIISC